MILDRIVHHKKRELRALKKKLPIADLIAEIRTLAPKKRRFLSALKKKRFAVIAEIKKRSPSKGVLSRHFDPLKIAAAYKRGGASALSVLTDAKFFGGSTEILKKVSASSSLPILRKDFILEEYQVYESRLIGADAVLLIASILTAGRLKRLSGLAAKLGMDVLFEVHSTREAKKIRPLKPRLVGINNRDLRTFKVDLSTTERVAPQVKGAFLVSESGVKTAKDILRLRRSGVRAALIGESLMTQRNASKALKNLLGGARG